jgi:hypothetical protein
LPALLEAVAAELASLSDGSARLHALVERQAAAGPLGDAAIEDAQFVDFLVQHLETVGLFMRLLAAEAPSVDIDYARLRLRLPLADLARRLGGDEAAAADGGDLDLF